MNSASVGVDIVSELSDGRFVVLNVRKSVSSFAAVVLILVVDLMVIVR